VIGDGDETSKYWAAGALSLNLKETMLHYDLPRPSSIRVHRRSTLTFQHSALGRWRARAANAGAACRGHAAPCGWPEHRAEPAIYRKDEIVRALQKVFIAVGVSALLVSSCATDRNFVAGRQDYATQNALTRGRSDMSCPSATGSVISSTYLKAPESGEWQGQERAEFVIAVAGCDKRSAFLVVCPERADDCRAAQTPWK
jgi:hypothetical protein